MATYKTKHFGTLKAKENDEYITIETVLTQDDIEIEISILIEYADGLKNRMDEIIQFLDNYYKMHEAAKRYIARKYRENEEIADCLLIFAAKAEKDEFMENGVSEITINLEETIKHLEPPSVGFHEYQGGIILASVSYYCPDNEGPHLTLYIDKNCKVHSHEYYGYER
jgi:hypothetical protein